MHLLPPKVLKVLVQSSSDAGYWNELTDPNDVWVGYPYQFNLVILVDSQAHSSFMTREPYFYTGQAK